MINGNDRHLALVGGVESMSRIQLGLGQSLSDWVRKFQQARSLGERVSHVTDLKLGDIRLYIPSVTNRTTGMSMGEHTEITAKEWSIPRDEQDRVALESHQRASPAWNRGFFDDLVIPIGDFRRDTIPRKDTSLEKLARLRAVVRSDERQRQLTAGNSSPLTDGAAALWVASPRARTVARRAYPAAKLVDWEIAADRFAHRRLADGAGFCDPASARAQRLDLADIDLWEIHEAFAAQVLFHIKALESGDFVRYKAGVKPTRRLPARAHESERRQRRARPSLRRNRGAHPEPSREGARDRPSRAVRDRQHLHRRGSGRRGAVAVGDRP